MKFIVPFSLIISLSFSCSNNKPSSYKDNEDINEKSEGYNDGIYCANIEYYYSETGTNSTYRLRVEVESNLLVKIFWPNGGWRDDSHFTPPAIEDGTAEFTNDKGVDYTVNIINDAECNFSSS